MGIVTAGSMIDSDVLWDRYGGSCWILGNEPSMTKMEASQAAPAGAKNIEFAKDYGLT